MNITLLIAEIQKNFDKITVCTDLDLKIDIIEITYTLLKMI